MISAQNLNKPAQERLMINFMELPNAAVSYFIYNLEKRREKRRRIGLTDPGRGGGVLKLGNLKNWINI